VSSAARSRRHRRHSQGLHDECSPKYCAAAGATQAAGSMTTAVAQYFSTLTLAPGDSRIPLLCMATELAALFDVKASPETSRELRQILRAVEELTPMTYGPTILEDLQRQRDARRAQVRRESEDD
jgi:hypothetical protein